MHPCPPIHHLTPAHADGSRLVASLYLLCAYAFLYLNLDALHRYLGLKAVSAAAAFTGIPPKALLRGPRLHVPCVLAASQLVSHPFLEIYGPTHLHNHTARGDTPANIGTK